MRLFNVWVVRVVGVQMVKVNQYQTPQPPVENRYARKLAKSIYDVHHPEHKAPADQEVEVAFADGMINVFSIVIY